MAWSLSLPLLTLLVLLIAEPGYGQEVFPPELPGAFDAAIRQMQFDTPTQIVGRLVTFDAYDDAIWIEWTQLYNGGRWLPVPPGMQFVVYPRDAGMMDFFRRLQPGAILHMTIRSDREGKRRVLELEGT
jgi:hypothetical protein